MEVIIHLLGSKEGQEELGKCVATVYAQLIYNYISRLECSPFHSFHTVKAFPDAALKADVHAPVPGGCR